MGKGADISWLHPPGFMPGATWSPWSGCTKVHTGCTNCWAEAMNRRFRGGNWGKGAPRRVTAESGWKHPAAWARAAAKAGKRMVVAPLDCDPLDEEVYNVVGSPLVLERGEWELPATLTTFRRFMALIRETGALRLLTEGTWGNQPWAPWTAFRQEFWPTDLLSEPGITWSLLTKRPENWRWIPEDVRRFCWLIYSASDQSTLDAGIPHLLEAEGFAGLGLSLEPLVGPIDMAKATGDISFDGGGAFGRDPRWKRFWMIIGGESGPKARPCSVDWIRDLVRQCRSAGMAPFVKQLGDRPTDDPGRWRDWRGVGSSTGLGDTATSPTVPVLVDARAGADPSEWPENLRVQEWPEGLR